MNVVERLIALAEGKKLTRPTFGAGKYIELRNDRLVNHAGDPYNFHEFVMDPQDSNWGLYQEPQPLECWVVWSKNAKGQLVTQFAETKEEADEVSDAWGSLHLHTEHVRVEVPVSKTTEDTIMAAVDNAKQGKVGGTFKPEDFEEPFTPEPNEALKNLMQKKHTREMWVNVYPGHINGHNTKEGAEWVATNKRIACVKVVVEYSDGEGLG